MHPDIKTDSGSVYFTGNPYTTARERPESILYLFIAMAESAGTADEATLTACKVNAPFLAHVDRPAVYTAVRALLAVKTPAPVLEIMRRRDILKYAFGFPLTDFSLLIPLEKIEAAAGAISPWQTRLMLLLLTAPLPPEEALKHLIIFLKLNDKDSAYLKDLLDFFPAADPSMPEAEKTALTEKYDADFVKSLFFLRETLEKHE